MKRRKINNDIHTNTKGFSLSLRLLRKGLKVLSQIAPGIAVKVVTKMFLKPSRKKIGEKQQAFYNDGITDTLKIEGHKVKVLRKGSGKPVLIIHGWGSYALSD